MTLSIGDKIPTILGKDQTGKEVKASDLKGKKIILYFYPKDNTPGCTAEACNFRDNIFDIKKKGYEIIGISVDDEKSHNKFIEKFELPFTLIADTNKSLVQEFGIWAEKTLAGKKYMGTLLSTFIIDEEGTIIKIFTHKDIKAKEHAEQILEWLSKSK